MKLPGDALVEHLLTRHDDHDHDHDHEDDEDPTVAKAVAMCILFLVSMTLGCLPLKLSKWFKWNENPKSSKVVDLLLCFGGGVLMATTFLHLLPEVAENLEELQTDGLFPDVDFHLPELLMCVGFFTMYLVEECVHCYLRRRQKNELNVFRRTLSIRRGENIEAEGDVEKTKETNNNHNHEGHNQAGHSHIVIEDSIVKSMRGLLIVLALSVHELFEGLSVGLESSAAHVWYMFGAVSVHKFVIAFCIGVELVSIKTRTLLAIIYVFTFAVVSPLGIGIGILVSDHESNETDVASVILQGLASGTLLYVVFFEILQSERKSGLKQWLAVAVGFAVMFVITFFTHEHAHEH